ncbi:MAG: GDSL-type esterase/lipase family protein [Candidatus Solibacter sp.]
MRLVSLLLCSAFAASAASAEKWVATWAASVHGPYPAGNASAQPNLRFAFPAAETGARDQTFRLIVQPDLWGKRIRLHFSNVFGDRPVTFDGVFAALHLTGGALVPNTNQSVRFGAKSAVTIAPGAAAWSDPVDLPFASASALLAGRKLAVSFHIPGESGRMTWHAKALTTSYLTAPGDGAKGQLDDESAFPYTTTSWYFLDAVDVMAPSNTRVVVAFGDSITDGTASTLNGDDRWPNALSRRLHAAYGNRVSVVNAGIGGNQVLGPAEYTVQKPFSGGPAAGQRLERDVIGLSGVSAVIWLEGINDFGANATAEAVEAGMREIVARLRKAIPGVRLIGATVVSALGNTSATHGSVEEDQKRRALNQFIRTGSVFDGVADFDRATDNPATGELRPEFVPDSTIGGPGDKLHPNRAGYMAMAASIDLKLLLE